jgi:hypothetical protein
VNVITHDEITPELKRIARQMEHPRPLMAAVGKELEVQLRGHFTKRDQQGNAQGFPRKHFWARVVRAATGLTEVQDRRATVTVASAEFLHKLTGGKVEAKRAKALSIPISAEAYKAGSASLFPKPLTMVVRRGHAPLLVETGIIGKSKAWKLHYILLKSVTHKKDPHALPNMRDVAQAILARGRAVLALVMQRRGR